MKFFGSIFSLLLIFGFGVTLLGNESVDIYFPDKLGSTWVYEDQDGKEFTRLAVEKKDIEGKIYNAFNYEPNLKDWENYEYYIYPQLYQVDDKWVAFYVGDDIEKAHKSILNKRLQEIVAELRKLMTGKLPPGITVEYKHNIEPKAQDFFYLFPMSTTLNEEWIAMQVDIKVEMSLNIQGAPVEIAKDFKTISATKSILETGKVTAKETVETDAGMFEDCLKIEYQTKTTTETEAPPEIKQLLPEEKPKESITTLWLAPNVGIVKFRRGKEQSDEVTTFELKRYEIKSDESENGENN